MASSAIRRSSSSYVAISAAARSATFARARSLIWTAGPFSSAPGARDEVANLLSLPNKETLEAQQREKQRQLTAEGDEDGLQGANIALFVQRPPIRRSTRVFSREPLERSGEIVLPRLNPKRYRAKVRRPLSAVHAAA